MADHEQNVEVATGWLMMLGWLGALVLLICLSWGKVI